MTHIQRHAKIVELLGDRSFVESPTATNKLLIIQNTLTQYEAVTFTFRRCMWKQVDSLFTYLLDWMN
jgi:hypothetical protein